MLGCLSPVKSECIIPPHSFHFCGVFVLLSLKEETGLQEGTRRHNCESVFFQVTFGPYLRFYA